MRRTACEVKPHRDGRQDPQASHRRGRPHLTRRSLALCAAAFLACAAGDPGRYLLRLANASCVVGPCPAWVIQDRVTGAQTLGDVRLAPSAGLDGSVKLAEPGWDLIADGELRPGAPGTAPVLWITKIISRTRH